MSDEYTFSPRWTVLYREGENQYASRPNCVIFDAGPGWIRIKDQQGVNHTIAFTHLISLTRKKERTS